MTVRRETGFGPFSFCPQSRAEQSENVKRSCVAWLPLGGKLSSKMTDEGSNAAVWSELGFSRVFPPHPTSLALRRARPPSPHRGRHAPARSPLPPKAKDPAAKQGLYYLYLLQIEPVAAEVGFVRAVHAELAVDRAVGKGQHDRGMRLASAQLGQLLHSERGGRVGRGADRERV